MDIPDRARLTPAVSTVLRSDRANPDCCSAAPVNLKARSLLLVTTSGNFYGQKVGAADAVDDSPVSLSSGVFRAAAAAVIAAVTTQAVTACHGDRVDGVKIDFLPFPKLSCIQIMILCFYRSRDT